MSDHITENTYSQLTQNDSLFNVYSDNKKEENHSKIEDIPVEELFNIFHLNRNHIENEEEIDMNNIYFTDNSFSSSEIKESMIEKIKSPIVTKNVFNIFNSTQSISEQFIKKKRGRQVNISNSKDKNVQKTHNKFATDNLIRKIQVHYMSFILEALNEVLKALNYDVTFFKCAYEFKKNVNKDFFESLKKKKLYDIISNDISTKYKNKDIKANKKLYDNLKKNKILKNLFDEDYITFFENVYFKSEKKFSLKKYGLEKEIIFSKKVKMYKDLLKDNKDNDVNNKKYIENINICVAQNYLQHKKFMMYKD